MKKGFTLSETLITLCLVGILASVIVSVLISKIPNREMLLFKKAYSHTEQVVTEMLNDETLYPSGEDAAGFADFSAARFGGQVYSGNSKFCGIFAAKLGVTCVNNAFSTIDGTHWQFPVTSFSAAVNSIQIVVDVDGLDNGENTVETATSKKPDRFRIIVTKNGNVSVLQHDNSCSKYTTTIDKIYIDEKDTTKKYKDIRK